LIESRLKSLKKDLEDVEAERAAKRKNLDLIQERINTLEKEVRGEKGKILFQQEDRFQVSGFRFFANAQPFQGSTLFFPLCK